MQYLLKVPFLNKLNLLSPQEIYLTVINTSLSFGQGTSSLFLNIYLWKQTNGIIPVVLFNIFQYPAILIVSLLIGALPLKIEIRKLLSLGFVFYIISYALLIALGGKAGHFIVPLGILFGIATGIYWAGNNAFIYLSTKDNSRDNYYAINSTIGSVISIISPLIAGIILSQTQIMPNLPGINYYLLFSIVISVFLFGFYYSYKLPKEFMPKVTIQKAVKPAKNPLWRLAGTSAFFDGFRGGSLGFITSILAFQILAKEINLAIYTSSFSLIGTLVSFLLIGRLNRKNRMKFGLIGSLLFVFSHLIYILLFSSKGIIVSSFIGVFANPLFNLGLASTFFFLIDSHPAHKEEYFTYITFREIPIALGRMTGAGLFLLLLGIGGELLITKTWFIILGFIPLIFYIITHKFNQIAEKQFEVI